MSSAMFVACLTASALMIRYPSLDAKQRVCARLCLANPQAGGRPARAMARMLAEGAAEKADPEVLYAVGLTISKQLAEIKSLLQPSEARIVGAALTDALCGTEREDFDWSKYGARVDGLLMDRMMAAQQEAESAGEGLLKRAAAEEGAVVTATGLIFQELLAGDGASPTAESTVTAHYTGTLGNGEVFDSSVLRGTPLVFPLGSVVKGWQEGLLLMRVGGRAILTLPATLAYGDQGAGPIPGGSVLRFEVELIKVE